MTTGKHTKKHTNNIDRKNSVKTTTNNNKKDQDEQKKEKQQQEECQDEK